MAKKLTKKEMLQEIGKRYVVKSVNQRVKEKKEKIKEKLKK